MQECTMIVTEPTPERNDTIRTPAMLQMFQNELQFLEHQFQQLNARINAYLTTIAHETTASSALEFRVAESPARSNALMQIRFFGSFCVTCSERRLPRSGLGKGWELLKYLGSYLNQSVPRDVLLETFWPNVEPAAGNNRLKVAIHALRRALQDLGAPEDSILFNAGGYQFNPHYSVTSDVAMFRQKWQQGSRYIADGHFDAALACYNEAAMLYSGDFLADDPYAEWTMVLREELRDIAIDIFDRRSRLYQQRGELFPAIENLKRIVMEDELREDIYRRIIAAYAESGQRASALHWFQRCCAVLDEHLGCEPEIETMELYRALDST